LEIKFRVVELKTPRFSTAIGSNLYAKDRVEYFSVFLVAVISATVPASVAALSLLLLSYYERTFHYHSSLVQYLCSQSFCGGRLQKEVGKKLTERWILFA